MAALALHKAFRQPLLRLGHVIMQLNIDKAV